MIITIAAIKGGVGKTTISMIIAEMFARSKKSVVLLDLDKQGSAVEFAAKTKGTMTEVSPLDPKKIGVGKLPRRIREITNDYDVVIIDTPPGEIDVADVAIGESDFVLIPTLCETEPMRQAVNTFKDFEASSSALMLNMVDRTSRDYKDARGLLETHKLPLFKTEIPNWVSIKRIHGSDWNVDEATQKVFLEFFIEVVDNCKKAVAA